jgi:hypothetical protein
MDLTKKNCARLFYTNCLTLSSRHFTRLSDHVAEVVIVSSKNYVKSYNLKLHSQNIFLGEKEGCGVIKPILKILLTKKNSTRILGIFKTLEESNFSMKNVYLITLQISSNENQLTQ